MSESNGPRPVLASVTIRTVLQDHTHRVRHDPLIRDRDEDTPEDIGECIAECLHSWCSDLEVDVLCHAILAECIRDGEPEGFGADQLEELKQAANAYLTKREKARAASIAEARV